MVFKSSAAVFLNEDAESSQKRGLAGAASAAVGALMSSTDVISGAVRRNERRGRRFWTFLCLERQKKKTGLIIQDRRLCFRLRNYGAKITKYGPLPVKSPETALKIHRWCFSSGEIRINSEPNT